MKNVLIAKSETLIDKTNDFSVFEITIKKGIVTVFTTETLSAKLQEILKLSDACVSVHKSWNLKHELSCGSDIKSVVDACISAYNTLITTETKTATETA